MKKIFILLNIFFFSAIAYSFDKCLEIEHKLWMLQNKIVLQSFQKLPKGAWAKYGFDNYNIKAVNLGEQISPKTGKKLYVIEFNGGPVEQIWYKITPKYIQFHGKTFKYLTLEPMEIYALIGNGIFYIPKGMIETYMRMTGGNSWSRILKEGNIVPAQKCQHILEIKNIIYHFPYGKKVKATIIKSKVNGAMVYCSPNVPFGMIKVTSPDEPNIGGLVDFGFSNGNTRITKDMIRNSSPLPFIPGLNSKNPGAMPFNFYQ